MYNLYIDFLLLCDIIVLSREVLKGVKLLGSPYDLSNDLKPLENLAKEKIKYGFYFCTDDVATSV